MIWPDYGWRQPHFSLPLDGCGNDSRDANFFDIQFLLAKEEWLDFE
jgi:hypothetical protein